MTTPVCSHAIDLVKYYEGLRTQAYRCPAGVWTIGYGHTRGVTAGMACTERQAAAWLAEDLAQAAAAVDRCVTVPLGPEERGALASFQFNTGALAGSTLLRLLNAGDRAGAAAQFGRWTKARVNGILTDLPGLKKRRAAEAALFQRGSAAGGQDGGAAISSSSL